MELCLLHTQKQKIVAHSEKKNCCTLKKKKIEKICILGRFQKYLRLASEVSEAAKANNSSSLSSGTGCSSVKASIEAAAPMYLGIIDFLR